MDRVFLDANILVSVAWKPVSRVHALWALTDIERLTSTYAITEAVRNVLTTERQARLFRAIQNLRIVDDPQRIQLPAGVRLAAKDAPILAAAIQARASHYSRVTPRISDRSTEGHCKVFTFSNRTTTSSREGCRCAAREAQRALATIVVVACHSQRLPVRPVRRRSVEARLRLVRKMD